VLQLYLCLTLLTIAAQDDFVLEEFDEKQKELMPGGMGGGMPTEEI